MAGYIGSKTVNLSTTGADIAGDADVSGALDVGGAFTSKGIDDNATSTAMTLDGSGNLLVGKTAADGATDGGEIRAGGTLVNTTNNSTTAYFNRRTSDGDLISFQKDGSTVGSIGVATAGVSDENLYIANGDTGLRFRYNDDSIIPSNNTGSFRDNAIDLGLSNARFKDLYLSGGVYLGGTGASNKLDDYEEGNHNPTSGSGASMLSSLGRYTKVGNICVYYFRIVFGTETSGTGSYITIPFTSASEVTNAHYASGVPFYTTYTATQVRFGIIQNNTRLEFYNGTTSPITFASLSGKQINGSIVYRTS